MTALGGCISYLLRRIYLIRILFVTYEWPFQVNTKDTFFLNMSISISSIQYPTSCWLDALAYENSEEKFESLFKQVETFSFQVEQEVEPFDFNALSQIGLRLLSLLRDQRFYDMILFETVETHPEIHKLVELVCKVEGYFLEDSPEQKIRLLSGITESLSADTKITEKLVKDKDLREQEIQWLEELAQSNPVIACMRNFQQGKLRRSSLFYVSSKSE